MIQVGPFSLPPSLLIAVGALLGAYGLGRVSASPAERESHARLFDALVTALLVFVLGWKLFPLLEAPGRLFSDPLALLYQPGGTGGVVLGAAAAALSLLYAYWRGRGRSGAAKAVLLRTLAGVALGAGAAALVLVIFAPGREAQLIAERTEGGETVRELLRGEQFSLLDGEMAAPDWDARFLVVNIWASWGPPCRGEMPELAQFYRSAAAENTELLAVNLTGTEKSLAGLRRFVAEQSLPFPVLLDPEGRSRSLCDVQALPTTCIFGPDGALRARHTGAVSADWLRRHTRD
jgi:thiol-disulfide isomerase/thioredoxin